MAKVTGPLMSLDASGSVAGTITFSKWKGRNYVRQTVTPANPKSPAQTSFRAMFGFLSAAWKLLSAPNQASWEALATGKAISPFNAYSKENQRRWTQALAPGQAPNPTGTGTPSTIALATATGGVRQIEIDIPLAGAGGGGTEQWGIIIYRSTTTGFTPAQSNVVGVIPGTDGTTVKFVDLNLIPDTYFYRLATFSVDGVTLVNGTQISATAS